MVKQGEKTAGKEGKGNCPIWCISKPFPSAANCRTYLTANMQMAVPLWKGEDGARCRWSGGRERGAPTANHRAASLKRRFLNSCLCVLSGPRRRQNRKRLNQRFFPVFFFLREKILLIFPVTDAKLLKTATLQPGPLKAAWVIQRQSRRQQARERQRQRERASERAADFWRERY